MEDKNYDLILVDKNKINSSNLEEDNKDLVEIEDFQVGDKVTLLDYDQSAIIYKPRDNYNNVEVLYNNEFITVNVKRVKLQLKAKDLYPEGYDLNSLFVSFDKRKLERDIKRGSKKALRKIQKEIRNNK